MRAWSVLLLAAVPLASLSLSCGKNTAETASSPAQYKVRLSTSKGDVLILVHRDWAPIGADHFYELTKMGFYDGDRFFRALPGFIVQWGINGNPKLNQEWSETPIKDDPPKVSNKIGTVAFAKTNRRDSRCTQAFVNLADNSRLDAQGYTPFGEVIQGMENLDNVYIGYGDGPPNGSGPNQALIAESGNAYLVEHFPRLDYIIRARIVP